MSSDRLIYDVTLGSSDLQRSATFYDAVLGALGYKRSPETTETWIGWGPGHDEGVSLWVTRPYDGKAPTAGNGTMVTFRARNEAEVQAFHKAALTNGGSDEGKPGTRPHYSPTFYVAYVRDPDRNKLACVFDRHEPDE
ncbi:MAG TPA: VOC family protein [Kiloniellales bacterium]|nr:VOC family protein [Kiloniellales bacterium]